MKFLFQTKSIFLFPFIAPFLATAQKQDKCQNCSILAYTPIYASHLVSLGDVSFENLYLLSAKDSINIDSLIFKLSQQKYRSNGAIFDSLIKYFSLYEFIDIKSKDKKLDIRIRKDILDNNNYKKGFLFFLEDGIAKYNSTIGYIFYFFTNNKKIKNILNAAVMRPYPNSSPGHASD